MTTTAGSPKIDYQFLTAQLDAATSGNIYEVVVSAPFANGRDMVFLFLGFICLYIVDEKTDRIQLVAVSGTEEYRLSVEHMDFKPEDYTLRFDKNKNNTIVQAVASGKPKHTLDWATLNRGQTPTAAVRLNQANSGIAYTAIHPLLGPTKGALMYNYYQYPDGIGDAQEAFMKRYTKLVSRYLGIV
jgi:hypothetical protein